MGLDFNNQKWVYRPHRVKLWRNFTGNIKGNILVCGLDEVETKIAPDAELIGTQGDFNTVDWEPLKIDKYENAFCFEVIEHLCNPLLFLIKLKSYLTDNGKLFVSFPSGRPQFLWTNGHFHEYGKKRAEKLFEMAGYKIARKTRTSILWKKPHEYFKGVRPLLRLFFPLRCLIYELEKLKD